MSERVKRPAYQWYPGDFRRDTAVQACSFEARALWREMLDLMHDGEPYGHLTAGGVPIAAAALARMVGQPAGKVIRWIAELEARKVFSRTTEDVIFSRRMLKDELVRKVRGESGKLGGNPALLVNQPDKPPTTKAPRKNQPLSTATAVAVASANQVSVADLAIRLAVRANQGLAEHTERPQLIPRIIGTNGRTFETAEAIAAAGVPLEFAEETVYELARSHVADGEVKSLKYFEAAVLRAWQDSQNNTAAAAFAPMERKTAGAEIFAQIRALAKSNPDARQGNTRFIPKAEVAKLGPAALKAYDDIGGATRVLAAMQEPKALGFLIREFSDAYTAAQRAIT